MICSYIVIHCLDLQCKGNINILTVKIMVVDGTR